MELRERCRPIKLILSDVDGVLTDGRLIYDSQGNESKQFHIRDGQGIRLWQQSGRRFGLMTLRNSPIVQRRVEELEIEILRQSVSDKGAELQAVLDETGLSPEQVCYIGDDLPDLPAIRLVGLGVAVADACLELRESAGYVTRLGGGQGAVREVIEKVLKAQGYWNKAIERFTD